MRRVRDWFNRQSVKTKLIFYSYLTLIPVMLLVCVGLLFYNYHKALQEQQITDRTVVQSLADNIETLQMDIKDFSTYICINEEIRTILTANDPEQVMQNQRFWLEDAPMQIIQDMIALKGHIKSIAIYPENGITPYLRGMDGSVYQPTIEEAKQSEAYRETLESSNGMIWRKEAKGSSGVYRNNPYDKIILCREIYDLSQKTTLGYIVIGVGQEFFQERCENSIRKEGEGILVLDPNTGEMARAGEIPAEVEAYLCGEEFLNMQYKNRPESVVYEGYNIVCRQNGKNSCIICKVAPEYEIQIGDIVYMPATLFLGMFLGLLPLLLIISNVFTKPLRHVSEAIRKFSEGDFEQQVEVESQDEIGEVAECFNKMVVDIRTLINENYAIRLSEKESELAALQAQINPHFLYNTLDSLYWQAQGCGNEEMAENILALSQLFRLVLNRGQNEVCVEQEVELISTYLQIQKMRFGKRLNYQIEVDEEIKKKKMPKLVLQPFVENAVVHGFENVESPGYLTISGRKKGKRIHWEIKDNGAGMTEEQIREIWEQEPASYSKQRIGRYAIKNIRERLRLKYHEEYVLKIESCVGKGTTVILEFPCEEE